MDKVVCENGKLEKKPTTLEKYTSGILTIKVVNMAIAEIFNNPI